MTRTWIWLALGAALSFAAPAQAATDPGPACGRVCLGKLLDGYLSAMVAHDPDLSLIHI